MTRLQRGYLAMAVIGFIIAALHAWSEREYLACGERWPSPRCQESPVLDTTELATDFAYAIGWVGLIMFVVWLILWVLRGKPAEERKQ